MSKKKTGRPTLYTPELSDEICEKLSEGKSLRTVCKAEHLPCKATVFSWLRLHPEFLDQYTRAKEESADALTDEMLDIADDATNDYMLDESGDGVEGYRINGENVQRSRLRIETRKWIAAKLKPKVYGDRSKLVTDDGNGGDAPIGQPIDLSKLSDSALDELIEATGGTG